MAAKGAKKSQAKRTTVKKSTEGAGSKRKQPSAEASLSALRNEASKAASNTTANDGGSPPKRAKKQGTLSRLEQLPTEVLQDIFALSENLNLPLASEKLRSQLSSQHMYLRMTTTILGQVFNAPRSGTRLETAALDRASALLNAKFFTLEVCKAWLDEMRSTVPIQPGSGSQIGIPYYNWLWQALNPPYSLRTPAKALRGPWTQERMNFLRVVAPFYQFNREDMDLAREGLLQAIKEQCMPAITLLTDMLDHIDTGILRAAVFSHGCDKTIVAALMQTAKHNLAVLIDAHRDSTPPSDAGSEYYDPPCEVDFSDQKLRAWAKKAKDRGDPKGQWLLSEMDRHARDVTEPGNYYKWYNHMAKK